jgi:hypothetical protein
VNVPAAEPPTLTVGVFGRGSATPTLLAIGAESLQAGAGNSAFVLEMR